MLAFVLYLTSTHAAIDEIKRINNVLITVIQRELPKDRWILWNIHIIRLGRTICKAPTPNCAECFLQGVCIDYANREKAKKTLKKIPGKKKEAAKKTADEKKKAAGKTADKKEESSKEDGR